jgi:ATP/maltotriose-dependent transcriptional regulator MalT
LSSTRGYLRPLLDAGEPIRGVLRASLNRPLSPFAREQAYLILKRFRLRHGEGDRVTITEHESESLTDREAEVLNCLVEARSNKEIASLLFVSIDTVKTHLKHIYVKLGVRDRYQAVSRARELGLATEEDLSRPT